MDIYKQAVKQLPSKDGPLGDRYRVVVDNAGSLTEFHFVRIRGDVYPKVWAVTNGFSGTPVNPVSA